MLLRFFNSSGAGLVPASTGRSASLSSPYLTDFKLALDPAARKLLSQTALPVCRDVVFFFSSSLLCSASFTSISSLLSLSLFHSPLPFLCIAPGRGRFTTSSSRPHGFASHGLRVFLCLSGTVRPIFRTISFFLLPFIPMHFIVLF